MKDGVDNLTCNHVYYNKFIEFKKIKFYKLIIDSINEKYKHIIELRKSNDIKFTAS